MQNVKVTLVDVNPKMVAAWREVFENNPEVTVLQGSMLDQKVSAWVSPTNAKGEMAGGLDGVIKKHFGPKIQTKVQSEIARLKLPAGTVVEYSLPPAHWLRQHIVMLSGALVFTIGGEETRLEAGDALFAIIDRETRFQVPPEAPAEYLVIQEPG